MTGEPTPLGRYDEAAERSAAVVIGRYSTSFGAAARLLDPASRRRIRSIYALVRVADEVVDGTAREAGLDDRELLDVLDRLTEKPERPYTVVLGGSKVSDKLGVISHLLPRVDRLLVGGGMLFTFLAAQGHRVGASLLESDQASRSGREVQTSTDNPPAGLGSKTRIFDDAWQEGEWLILA